MRPAAAPPAPQVPPSLMLGERDYLYWFLFVQVKDQINCEFRMHGLVERSVNCAERLLTLYEDKDG